MRGCFRCRKKTAAKAALDSRNEPDYKETRFQFAGSICAGTLKFLIDPICFLSYNTDNKIMILRYAIP